MFSQKTYDLITRFMEETKASQKGLTELELFNLRLSCMMPLHPPADIIDFMIEIYQEYEESLKGKLIIGAKSKEESDQIKESLANQIKILKFSADILEKNVRILDLNDITEKLTDLEDLLKSPGRSNPGSN
jgi:hypothetical protein